MAVKKLIEVALPLDAINAASAREKSIRHGHPSTLHLWWARRPLAAARAVIWSSLVDDPSSHPELFPTEEAQTKERERLFEILEKLVKWENSNDKETLDAAKAEIRNSMGSDLPAPSHARTRHAAATPSSCVRSTCPKRRARNGMSNPSANTAKYDSRSNPARLNGKAPSTARV